MSIQLPADIEERVRALIADGRYGDEGDVLRAALRALDAREADEQLQRLRTLVLEGFASGDPRELTPELMDELDREAVAAFERGERPSPHVCP